MMATPVFLFHDITPVGASVRSDHRPQVGFIHFGVKTRSQFAAARLNDCPV
jgi:hypothetical protein